MDTIIVALLILGLVYLCCFYWLTKIRPSSVGLTFFLALSALICFESVVLNILSLFNAVTKQWVILTHVIVIIVSLICAVRSRATFWRYCLRIFRRCKRDALLQPTVTLLLIPLIAIVTLTAFLYVPNTYDSMTYHMARVAHWMQQGSVGYFETHISRQNQMGPGAEYLILFLQIVSGSDRLANGVQLFSFILMPIGLFYLLRVLKVDRKISPWVVLLCMTTPMATLQATSTQNDLVDSVITISIIITSMRFFIGNAKRLTTGECFLAAICCSAGYLVKPISLIVAFPFFLTGLIIQRKRLAKLLVSSTLWPGLLASLTVLAIVCGPDVVRKSGEDVFSRPEIYPLLHGWDAARLFNPLAIMAHNFPFPNLFESIVNKWDIPMQMFNRHVFNIHEDVIGNPVQLIFLIVSPFSAVILFFFRPYTTNRCRNRLILWAFLPILSWCLFGWVIKNQEWITRLQLPLFFLLPFSMALFSSRYGYFAIKKIIFFIVIVITLFSYTYGMMVVLGNPSRPLKAKYFWGHTPSPENVVNNYYRNFNKKKETKNFLKVAWDQHCKRVSLLLYPDYPEYPLTWLAMQIGIETRHGFSEKIDGWPCMLFADGVKDEYVPERGVRWLARGDEHTFVRNLEYEFNNSFSTIMTISNWSTDLNLKYNKNSTAIEYNGDRLLINATDDDPSIYLPEINFTGVQNCIIQFILDSPVDTVFKLYYQANEDRTYSEDRVFRKKIYSDENIIYFQIPADIVTGSFRVDPGDKPVVYLLRKVEIRNF